RCSIRSRSALGESGDTVPLMRLLRIFMLCAVAGCGPSVQEPALTSIEIMPADAMLAYEGTPLTLDYTAMGTFADGHRAPIPDAVFSLDAGGALLGSFAAATFSVSGLAAGKGGVFATVGDVVASTTVLVTSHPTRLGPGVPSDAPGKFPDGAPTGAGSP